MRITLGLIDFADTVSRDDAICVQSLRAAGAIVYVKTTMPQTGMVLTTLLLPRINPANLLRLWKRLLNSSVAP
jgi:Asp-tRNA(Asn)/Glu-tRNA(Gln) amidotransferase A subunit family amidase